MHLVNRLRAILRSEWARPSTTSFDPDFTSYREESGKSEYGRRQDFSQVKETSLEDQYYANLELAPGSSFTLIRGNYLKLIKMYHPDLYSGREDEKELAIKITSQLNEAYAFFKLKYGKK